MANGHGGARPGSGRKKKPLSDKIAEDFPGKRKPKALGFAQGLPADTEPPEYLDEFISLDIAQNANVFYRETVSWLDRTGCLHLINPHFIAEYALLKNRWMECEIIAKGQLFIQDHNHAWVANPAADLALKYLKQADAVWTKIWTIVVQNCEYNFGGENPNADIMGGLLTADLE